MKITGHEFYKPDCKSLCKLYMAICIVGHGIKSIIEKIAE